MTGEPCGAVQSLNPKSPIESADDAPEPEK
jgi:hypothetical protein